MIWLCTNTYGPSFLPCDIRALQITTELLNVFLCVTLSLDEPFKLHLDTFLWVSKELLITYALINTLYGQEKKNCSTGEEIPKSCRSAQFLFIFFLYFFAKITRKGLQIMICFLARIARNFSLKFLFLKKKNKNKNNSANGGKAVRRARRAGFLFFLALSYFLFCKACYCTKNKKACYALSWGPVRR